MIIAMVPMRMMQAAIDEVIDMVTVRHRLVTTSGAVLVTLTSNFRGATHRVFGAYRDGMLVDVIAMRV
ncbi:MAG: hypothetical protein WC807_21265 [Hyphomicrobium sp.]|jgi:hypothetical protein